MGYAYDDNKEYANALANYKEALQIRIKLYGKDNGGVASTYFNMGIAYNCLKNGKESVDCMNKSALAYNGCHAYDDMCDAYERLLKYCEAYGMKSESAVFMKQYYVSICNAYGKEDKRAIEVGRRVDHE